MVSPRIVMITSDHRRHRWVAARLAQAGNLVGVVVERKPATSPSSPTNSDMTVQSYFRARDEAEHRYFADAPAYAALGTAVLQVAWGGANTPDTLSFVTDLAPDAIVLFGSCIIKDPLLGQYAGRMINMHLGLSPYYRGSATNFWPLVDGLPECVGVTVHHAILKVDGGSVLAQARPDAALGDDAMIWAARPSSLALICWPTFWPLRPTGCLPAMPKVVAASFADALTSPPRHCTGCSVMLPKA